MIICLFVKQDILSFEMIVNFVYIFICLRRHSQLQDDCVTRDFHVRSFLTLQGLKESDALVPCCGMTKKVRAYYSQTSREIQTALKTLKGV